MPKPPAVWPAVGFPYDSYGYIHEDSASERAWRGEGTVEPGKIVTLLPPIRVAMENTALVVLAGHKGNMDGSGFKLYATSPTAGCAQDFVACRVDAVPFQGYLGLAIIAHSPEGGSHNPGPHEWTLHMETSKKVSAWVTAMAIYSRSVDRYPKEMEYGYGAISGPYGAKMLQLYGPHA